MKNDQEVRAFDCFAVPELERTQAWSPTLLPPLYCSVTLGKSLNVSEPQFPHLNKGGKNIYVERVFLDTLFFSYLLIIARTQRKEPGLQARICSVILIRFLLLISIFSFVKYYLSPGVVPRTNRRECI